MKNKTVELDQRMPFSNAHTFGIPALSCPADTTTVF